MKSLVAACIAFYQKFLSPLKGYRCAYAALHGGDPCSEAVKKLVIDKGCFGAYQDIRVRFQACREANETLIRNDKRRRSRCDYCDCDSGACADTGSCRKLDSCDDHPGCDLPDLPCDSVCDCSI